MRHSILHYPSPNPEQGWTNSIRVHSRPFAVVKIPCEDRRFHPVVVQRTQRLKTTIGWRLAEVFSRSIFRFNGAEGGQTRIGSGSQNSQCRAFSAYKVPKPAILWPSFLSTVWIPLA